MIHICLVKGRSLWLLLEVYLRVVVVLETPKAAAKKLCQASWN